MSTKFKLITWLLFSTLLNCHDALANSKVTRTIQFSNLTNQSVQQTQTPYLDNFSYYSSDTDYEFIAPDTTLLPKATTTASISYDWWHNWYNIGQFAFNYPGRSADYGCFVTTISLSWCSSYHIAISSYRKDPSNPNDYLICRVRQGSRANSFIVDFTSSQDTNEQKDYQLDDSKRYTIAGDNSEVHSMSGFGINKPIPLNPNHAQPALLLYPNETYPTVINNHYIQLTNPPSKTSVITVTNYASVPVVSGPSPLLDKYSQFDTEYSFEMPASISPGETVKVKIGTPFNLGDFDLERFSYQIAGYAPNSGCYITTSKRWISVTPVASFYFDLLHPEKNLYCLVTDPDTIGIYDDAELKQLKDQGCTENDLRNCISTYNHFYKDGDTLIGQHYKYKKLFLSPDDSKHYLNVNPGTTAPPVPAPIPPV